jgi:hypothetical protein
MEHLADISCRVRLAWPASTRLVIISPLGFVSAAEEEVHVSTTMADCTSLYTVAILAIMLMRITIETSLGAFSFPFSGVWYLDEQLTG